MIIRAIVVLMMLVAGAFPALAKRVALVVGNGAYQNAVELPNPANDARAMSTKLRELGFEVVDGFDLDYMGMRQSVANFARVARGADIAMLFYAGHGMQVRGQNYLIPVDAKFEDETSLDFETISTDFIMRQMSTDVNVRMMFLDACRDNPLARSLARSMGATRSASVGMGLAEMKVEENGGEGSVIAFATSPGDVALDGEGSNSPFTTALLRHLDAPNTSIQSVMTRVTGDVYRETGERQRPWVNASLIGEVFLNRVSTPAPAQNVQVAALGDAATTTTVSPVVTQSTTVQNSAMALEVEKVMWESAKAGNTIADYNLYIARYPNGLFKEFAQNAINRLSADTTTQAALTPNPGTVAPAAVPATPVVPPVTEAMRATPGTNATERSLGWDRNKRREVQTRLNLAGFNVGGADGQFGPKTRRGVTNWQTANGLIATGFFTGPQFERLSAQTQQPYVEELQRRASAAATRRSSPSKARSTRRATRRASTRQRNTRRSSNRRRSRKGNNANNAAAAAFVGGVVGGVVGGLIAR